MTVTEQYQYPDTQKGDEDAFAREPFIIRLRAPRTGESPEAPSPGLGGVSLAYSSGKKLRDFSIFKIKK